jgi:hypothetical protein
MNRLMALFDREEKGYPPGDGGATGGAQPSDNASYNPTSANINPDHNTAYDHAARIRQLIQHNRESLVPADNKLLIFRSLTGIDSVPALSQYGFFSRRTAPNIGIYTRVVQAEQKSAFRYRAFSILINTCLSIQIVVAAALTAIGAAQGPHGVITAFGAINTIMAGILTYLRGSGLPDREKNVEKSWGQIREYIEQREREFCLEDCPLSVENEIFTVERMYEEVRQQFEGGASESHGFRGQSLGEMRGRGSLLPVANTGGCPGRPANPSACPHARQPQSKETGEQSQRQPTTTTASDLADKGLD